MVFAILFSYQTVASSMFALIHCVNVNGSNVLFVDGNIACYQSWQIFTLIAIAFCLIPFSFYIMLAPGTLIKGQNQCRLFLHSLLLCAPIVSTFLYVVHKIQDKRKTKRTAIDNSNEVYVSPEAKAVYRILQGPYREYSIKFCGKKLYLCWSGMLLARRLMLILCDTFIYDLLLRVSTNYHFPCFQNINQPWKTTGPKERFASHTFKVPFTPSESEKESNFFCDVCRSFFDLFWLFFDLFRFRFRFHLVRISLKTEFRFRFQKEKVLDLRTNCHHFLVTVVTNDGSFASIIVTSHFREALQGKQSKYSGYSLRYTFKDPYKIQQNIQEPPANAQVTNDKAVQ